MLVEDEDESTRARGRGQLPKFGAVVEKIGWLFFRMGCGQENSNAIDSANWGAVSLASSDWEGEPGDEDQENFHREFTGNTERRFSLVVGCTRDENQTRHGFSRILTDQTNLR